MKGVNLINIIQTTWRRLRIQYNAIHWPSVPFCGWQLYISYFQALWRAKKKPPHSSKRSLARPPHIQAMHSQKGEIFTALSWRHKHASNIHDFQLFLWQAFSSFRTCLSIFWIPDFTYLEVKSLWLITTRHLWSPWEFMLIFITLP